VRKVLGIGYALVCIAVTIAIAVPWLNAKGIQVPLGGNGIPATLAGVVAAVAIFGLIGVGLGALLREQVATVVGLLVYLFIAEPIVTRIPALHSWTSYLPGAAANALTQVAQANQHFLPPWQGGLVLAAYASSWPPPAPCAPSAATSPDKRHLRGEAACQPSAATIGRPAASVGSGPSGPQPASSSGSCCLAA
jgi:hypothetical protein